MAAERPSAVRLYAPDHPALANTVAAKLQKEIQTHGNQLAEGYAKDWPDYQARIGFIKGLKRAIEMCQEADKEIR